MSKFVTLLGRKTETRNAGQAEQPPIGPRPPITQQPTMTPPAADTAPPQTEVELDEDLFVPIAARLGEETEAVRNLLLDAEHKIAELDTIKLSIAKLLDPVTSALRSYEEAKSEKLILQRALDNAQEVCSKLRDDLAAVQKKAHAFKAECARLHEVATVATQNMAALERNNSRQLAELAEHRTRAAELQNLAQRQASELQLARIESLRLGERATAADQKIVQLEAELEAIRQQAKQITHERAAVQASLDKTFNELAQTGRRLSEAEKAHASTRARLQAAERNLADAQAERSQLSATLDEAVHQHRDKLNVLGSRLETVQARSSLAENLLNEARQALASRADEIRALERRLIEASTAQGATAEKLSVAEAALAEREAQIKDLEAERAALTEHGRKLIQLANEREVANREAQQQMAEQNDLVTRLQDELAAARGSHEVKIEDLKAQLQREQLDRSMAEGALEGARKEMARLLAEISALRSRPLVPGAAEPSVPQDALRRAA
jgi:chromosome segregation ATPase